MGTPNVSAQKPCSKCKQTLPLSEFSPDKRMVTGVGSQCKACNRRRMKTYTARARGRKSEYNRAYRQKNKHRLNEANAAWLEKNRGVVIAGRRAKYRRDPQKAIAAQVRYRASNRGYIRKRQREYYRAHKADHLASTVPSLRRSSNAAARVLPESAFRLKR